MHTQSRRHLCNGPTSVEPIGTESITLATVTTLENGRFVVSWRDETFVGPDRASLAFKHQVFALDGTPVGTKTVVASSPTHHLGSENTTMLPDGRFMTIWSDDGSADQGHIGSLNGQIFTDAGVADSAVLTFATSPRGFGRRHSVAMLPDGGLALSWDSDPAGFSVQIINADGTLSGLTQHFTTSTAGGGGVCADRRTGKRRPRRCMAGTIHQRGRSSVGSLHAQLLDGNGEAIGPQFQISATTSDNQTDVEIKALPDGRFVAVWYSIASDFSIEGQVFNADGTMSGTEFHVASAGANGYISGLALQVLSDGRFTVSWQDDEAHARIYDPRVLAMHLEGKAGNDTLFGFAANDTIAGNAGNDILYGRNGHDGLFGSDGNDQVYGGNGSDLIYGGAGADVLSGESDGDVLFGDVGNDTMDGGTGNESLVGGAGDDTYPIETALDRIFELVNEGVDEIIASTTGIDLTSFANVEKAKLDGDRKLNLTGSAVGNGLIGNGGANDTDAGAGADFFVFRSAAEAGLGGGGVQWGAAGAL